MQVHNPFGIVITAADVVFYPVISPSYRYIVLMLHASTFVNVIIPIEISVIFVCSVFFGYYPRAFGVFGLIAATYLEFIPIVLIIFKIVYPLIRIIEKAVNYFGPVVTTGYVVGTCGVL